MLVFDHSLTALANHKQDINLDYTYIYKPSNEAESFYLGAVEVHVLKPV